MKVCFTGGGTGGHVFPGFAVDAQLKLIAAEANEPYERLWIGSRSPMERRWIERAGFRHRAICSGKLRRYASLRTIPDLFSVVIGCVQAWWILREERPHVLFSKGGFVSVPPVIAAYLLNIPVITHESDALPGLATKINSRFAQTICIPFLAVAEHFPLRMQDRFLVTGVPTRMHRELAMRERAFNRFDLPSDRPLIVVLGGSQGALQINTLVWDSLNELLEICSVLHQTGERTFKEIVREGYRATPFIESGLDDVLDAATVVISRSGATALADFLEMEVPMILIPLGLHASRGDQVENAKRMQAAGAAVVLDQDSVTKDSFVSVVKNLVLHDSRRREMVEAARALRFDSSALSLAQATMRLALESKKGDKADG